ncbi:hypothetical protein [Lysinibacter sp. HNR]|uniref:hypothetical protein n=1 Tax=Lysinibacter sp. HNR TaxID=3031408 RepID=UPI0024355250|nr:hypothetical protein [Lysinibacter sp. HNR]WGD38194.1 hypothetical protein FrondiHNR_04570 [Lysinibacter sp. HNR]
MTHDPHSAKSVSFVTASENAGILSVQRPSATVTDLTLDIAPTGVTGRHYSAATYEPDPTPGPGDDILYAPDRARRRVLMIDKASSNRVKIIDLAARRVVSTFSNVAVNSSVAITQDVTTESSGLVIYGQYSITALHHY